MHMKWPKKFLLQMSAKVNSYEIIWFHTCNHFFKWNACHIYQSYHKIRIYTYVQYIYSIYTVVADLSTHKAGCFSLRRSDVTTRQKYQINIHQSTFLMSKLLFNMHAFFKKGNIICDLLPHGHFVCLAVLWFGYWMKMTEYGQKSKHGSCFVL